jgi:hypothetical protein
LSISFICNLNLNNFFKDVVNRNSKLQLIHNVLYTICFTVLLYLKKTLESFKYLKIAYIIASIGTSTLLKMYKPKSHVCVFVIRCIMHVKMEKENDLMMGFLQIYSLHHESAEMCSYTCSTHPNEPLECMNWRMSIKY